MELPAALRHAVDQALDGIALGDLTAAAGGKPHGDPLGLDRRDPRGPSPIKRIPRPQPVEERQPLATDALDRCLRVCYTRRCHRVGTGKAIDIDALVQRFLAWPLPKSVCADLCATNPNYPHPRSGTNLLTAVEARQLFEYLFSAPPTA